MFRVEHFRGSNFDFSRIYPVVDKLLSAVVTLAVVFFWRDGLLLLLSCY